MSYFVLKSVRVVLRTRSEPFQKFESAIFKPGKRKFHNDFYFCLRSQSVFPLDDGVLQHYCIINWTFPVSFGNLVWLLWLCDGRKSKWLGTCAHLFRLKLDYYYICCISTLWQKLYGERVDISVMISWNTIPQVDYSIYGALTELHLRLYFDK